MGLQEGWVTNTEINIRSWGIDFGKFRNKPELLISRLNQLLIEYEIDPEEFTHPDLVIISICLMEFIANVEKDMAIAKSAKLEKKLATLIARFKYICIFPKASTPFLNQENGKMTIRLSQQQLSQKILRESVNDIGDITLFNPNVKFKKTQVDDIGNIFEKISNDQDQIDSELSKKWFDEIPELFPAVHKLLIDHGYKINSKENNLPFKLLVLKNSYTDNSKPFIASHSFNFNDNTSRIILPSTGQLGASIEQIFFHEVAHMLSCINKSRQGIETRHGLSTGYKNVRFRGLNEAFTEYALSYYGLEPANYPWLRLVLSRLFSINPEFEHMISSAYFGQSKENLNKLEVCIINNLGPQALVDLEFIQYSNNQPEEKLDQLILTSDLAVFDYLTFNFYTPKSLITYINTLKKRFEINDKPSSLHKLLPCSTYFNEYDLDTIQHQAQAKCLDIALKLSYIQKCLRMRRLKRLLADPESRLELIRVLLKLDSYIIYDKELSMEKLEQMYKRLVSIYEKINKNYESHISRLNPIQRIGLRINTLILNFRFQRKTLASQI